MERIGSMVEVNYDYSRSGMLNVSHLQGDMQGEKTTFLIAGDRTSVPTSVQGSEVSSEMPVRGNGIGKQWLLTGSPDVAGAFWISSNHFKVLSY